MAGRTVWQRDELLLALRLYCRVRFGQLHGTNPEAIEVARLIGRTPAAVSMKACNFASFDPVHRARGIRGLRHSSATDQALWDEFRANAESIAQEAERVYDRFTQVPERPNPLPLVLPEGDTDQLQIVRVRRVQRFFRAAVLTSYDHRCALTGIRKVELLNASHIVPWGEDVARRADPCNGIALNAFHDRAFDRGFLTFDEDLRAVVSHDIEAVDIGELHIPLFAAVHGRRLTAPERFLPDPAALAFHREQVFRG